MKQTFLHKFEDFCLKHKLIKTNDTIVVGFSGGPDSTALILCLNSLKLKYKLKIIAAHVNYYLRGEHSIADENFVKNFCFSRNISLVLKQKKIEDKAGLENKARQIRFNFFKTTFANFKADSIALGHNLEDQAETVLFRFARGSGFTGLKGIIPKSGNIIHPLLGFSKAEIKNFLMQNSIIWQTDHTNEENFCSRNKIRNELVPWIKKELNPNIVPRIAANAEIFHQTDIVMNKMATAKLKGLTHKSDEKTYSLLINKLQNLLFVQRYYVYRLVIQRLLGDDKDFYSNHATEIDKILSSNGSKQLDLHKNIKVYKKYDLLIFDTNEQAELATDNIEITSIRSRLVYNNWLITMKKIKLLPEDKPFADKNTVYLDYDKIEFPLYIRKRQNGDRFMPFGFNKIKKLKDFFIDIKLPAFERDFIPIITDSKNIMWVGGLRTDARFAVKPETKKILKITLSKVTQKKRSAKRTN